LRIQPAVPPFDPDVAEMIDRTMQAGRRFASSPRSLATPG
jgi:hypothetical protein